MEDFDKEKLKFELMDCFDDSTWDKYDFEKLVNREATRLKLSLDAAKKLEEEHPGAPKIAFFHFPPVWNEQVFRPFVDLLHEAGIAECCFGHIHGIYTVPATTVFEGITFRFISADFLDFLPRLL